VKAIGNNLMSTEEESKLAHSGLLSALYEARSWPSQKNTEMSLERPQLQA
jgi:hypothetical protein